MYCSFGLGFRFIKHFVNTKGNDRIVFVSYLEGVGYCQTISEKDEYIIHKKEICISDLKLKMAF